MTQLLKILGLSATYTEKKRNRQFASVAEFLLTRRLNVVPSAIGTRSVNIPPKMNADSMSS